MIALAELLGIRLPIVQAPMAGVSTPALAAAVSNAGGLGSIAVGAADVAATRRMVRQVRALTGRPFNLNLFCHQPPRRDAAREARWLEALAPRFRSFGAAAPTRLDEVYRSFLGHDEMLALLLEERPPVVSFHFGAPPRATIDALHAAGARVLGSATNLDEARALEAAGLDAIVAQGYEAGGHRGVTDPDAPDDRLGTLALTRLLAARCRVPVVAAGGIMDGAGIAAALALGAAAAQLGTAFIGCPESGADDAYRAALAGPASAHTVMTRVVSGRPARCLPNRFTELAATVDERDVPPYPLAYAAGKALAAAARGAGETGYGAQWAGQGAPLARSLPAAELVAALEDERLQAAGAAAISI
ncbi:MAG TPA: nitronate monooxygenase [Polyangia bacterium]|nr:nitronate monooxygenase [Polyangia bacterium]